MAGKHLFLVFFGLVGCAPTESTLAKERVFEFRDGNDLANRASFDMNCPKGQLTATVLQRGGMLQVPVSAGVRGCGHQSTYVRSITGTWVLNGSVSNDLTASPAPAASHASPVAPSEG